MSDSETIKLNGWCQGAALSSDSCTDSSILDGSGIEFTDPNNIYIVVTQDCDLVQYDFGKEPFAELILAKAFSGKPNGAYRHGKNPRILQFPVGERYFEASCHDRVRIDRRILTQVKPCIVHALTGNTVGLIREWIAKRYIRPAFPDNFNQRIHRSAQGKEINKILESHGDLYRDIYLSCEPNSEELSHEQSYKVMVWVAMSADDFNETDKRHRALEGCQKLEKAFNNCPGIELVNCELRSESEITLDDLLFFKTWDYDYITFKEIGK